MNKKVINNPTNDELSTSIENMEPFDTIDVMTDDVMQSFGIDDIFTVELSIMKIPEGYLYTTYSDDSHSTVFVPAKV